MDIDLESLSTQQLFKLRKRISSLIRSRTNKVEQRAKWLEMLGQGYTLEQVAQEVGCTRAYVAKVVGPLHRRRPHLTYSMEEINEIR